MTALAWPAVKIRRISFHPQNPSRGGGPATNGNEQIVDSASGRWRANAEVIIDSQVAARAWDAFLGAMRGRYGTVNVPYHQGKRLNWPVDAQGRVLSPAFVRRRDLDGTAYEDPEVPTASAVTAVLDEAAAIGDTEVAIDVTQGTLLRAGQHFSTSGARFYRLAKALSTVGSVQTFTIWPAIRQVVSEAGAVELRKPLCEMRFETDDEGQVWDDGTGFANPSVSFVEAF